MSTVPPVRAPRQRKPRKPVERFCRISESVLGVRVLTLRIGKKVETYDVTEFPCDYGRGFTVTKADGTTYAVNVSGSQSTCDCLGHQSHGHCKHASALNALDANNLL